MLINTTDSDPVRLQVGIDAAIVANHHVTGLFCTNEETLAGTVRMYRDRLAE